MIVNYYRALAQWAASRRRKLVRWAHVLAPLAFLLAAVWMKAEQWSWTEWVQDKAFDTFQALRPRAYEPAPVRIVDIDDESLRRLGQWPWPRSLVARLVRRLNALGSSAIAFDIVFSEPDRSSPSRLASLWPDSPEIRALRDKIKGLPDNDRTLAEALSSARAVTGFVLTGEANLAVPAVKAGFAVAGDSPLSFLRDYSGAVTSLPILEGAAAGNGGFGFVPDLDGVLRRAPLLFRRGKVLLPSLAAEALRVAQGASGYAVKSSGASGEAAFGAHTGIIKVKIGSLVVPTDRDGRMLVYYTRPAPERTVPVWRVFEKDFEPERLAGCIAFIGTSAAGLKDLRVTPLSPVAPGVEVHANVAEQALLGNFLMRPDWALGAETLYMIVLGLGLMFLLPRFGAVFGALLGVAAIAVPVGFSWHAFTAWHYLIDPVFPCLTIVMIHMSSTLISYLRTEAERHQIKGAFGRYMAPALVEELARHPEKLRLGGETRTMTFHFCDIQGFTTISESYDPDGLTRFLNRFLTPMTDIILRHKGMIDKYIGDCIMAFWNAPLDDPDHARNACLAAVEMHETLRELNARWRAEAEAAGRKFMPIRLRTGLNTGPCVVGNMGSDQRFDYSVLGDDVNLASRLEGAGKFFHASTMVSEATIQGSRGAVVARELGSVRVLGKTTPVRVYNLLARKGELSPRWKEALPAYEEGIERFGQRDFDRAAACFKEVLKIFPDDGPSSLYLSRADDCLALPPPAEWTPVFNLTSK